MGVVSRAEEGTVNKDEKREQSEEIKAFIVFGDIRRSMAWLRRPSSTLEQQELLGKIRREIDQFESKYKYQIKRAADGFICVMEVFRENKKCQPGKSGRCN